MTDEDKKWYVYPMKTGPFTLDEAWVEQLKQEDETHLYCYVADAEGHTP